MNAKTQNEHGGDIKSYYEEYGRLPLDFSSNISPLGVPKSVVTAIKDFSANIDKYPDPFSRDLRNAISKKLHIPVEYITCGNGAADLIYRITFALKPKTGLILVPTFSEYESALQSVNCNVIKYKLQEDNSFKLNEEVLKLITPDLDIFFLCQPNNPTGTLINKNLLLKIIEQCTNTNTFLVLDECFVDFLDSPNSYSLISYLSSYSNLIILKAFTKLYGMAGIRLGYALSSNHEVLLKLINSGQPWPISSISEKAGIAALSDIDYVNRVRSLIIKERAFLYYSLIELGLRVIEPTANFILFKSPFPIYKLLENKNILIRDCSNFEGLGDLWYRIAVKTHSENQYLIAAIKEVLNEKS